MFELAALVVVGCVGTARAAARNPCNETACSDPQCQRNTGTDQCEFKTKIGRECAKKEHPLRQTCPLFCDFEDDGTYTYCKGKSAPFCENLPQQLCSDYGCTWQGNDTCEDDSTLTTPCDDPACRDHQLCQLNDYGKCEFKTEVARLCAAVKNPNLSNCPNYCEAVRNERWKYCKAKPNPTCDDLTPSNTQTDRMTFILVCEGVKGCLWDFGDDSCKNSAKTPCDDPGCLNSECQWNYGKCEFKTVIARLCAATRIPSFRNCPDYCTYVHTNGSQGAYSYCVPDSQPSCSSLPLGLCEDSRSSCEWDWKYDICRVKGNTHSRVLVAIIATACILVLSAMLVSLCCFFGWCCFAGQPSANGHVVIRQPPVVTVPQANGDHVYTSEDVPMQAISVNEPPADATKDPPPPPPPAC